ncbi:nidogen-like domain-containing protein [Ditylenchus destructor]|nr:nidogen-like domain-containing protein [Ditylenchus destructor]
MIHIHIFSIATLMAYANAIVPLEDFFGYGPEHGDHEVTLKHPANSSNAETLASVMEFCAPFAMFGLSFNRITLGDDGSLFASDTSTNGSHVRIWAFSGRVNLRKGGNLYFRKSTSSADLEKARQELNSAFTAYQDLNLKWAVIVSWIQIFPYGSFHDSTNTFQAIITTDGNLSFVTLNYNEILWSKKFWRLDASAGFEAPNGKYMISGSGSPEIATIGKRSNAGVPGKWIFRVDQPTISEPSSYCGIPPQPENGYCTAEGYTPESLAQCTFKIGTTMPAVDLQLKCSRQANNTSVDWTVNGPVCRSLSPTATQTPQFSANPSD